MRYIVSFPISHVLGSNSLFICFCFCFACLFVILTSLLSVEANIGGCNKAWHHVCITWGNGKVTVYHGKDIVKEQNLGSGSYRIPNGRFILGQKVFNSTSYDSAYSFEGVFSQINVWKSALDLENIRLLYLTCGWAQGDILKWDDFKSDKNDITPKNTDCPEIRGRVALNCTQL